MSCAATNHSFVPPAPADQTQLGAAVVRSLSRSYFQRFSWGPIKTLFLSAISLGILPLIIWPKKFRDYVTLERQELWHWATWLSRETNSPEAAQLVAQVENISPRRSVISLFIVIVTIVAALKLAFGVNASKEELFWLWTIGLMIGAVVHASRVAGHRRAIERTIESFNRFAEANRIRPIALPTRAAGTLGPWLVLGVLGSVCGAFWAIPMALAGAAQRRYINETSKHLREQAAQRVQQMMTPMLHDAGEPLQLPRRVCQRSQCRARLPQVASFCPRCGLRAFATASVA